MAAQLQLGKVHSKFAGQRAPQQVHLGREVSVEGARGDAASTSSRLDVLAVDRADSDAANAAVVTWAGHAPGRWISLWRMGSPVIAATGQPSPGKRFSTSPKSPRSPWAAECSALTAMNTAVAVKRVLITACQRRVDTRSVFRRRRHGAP